MLPIKTLFNEAKRCGVHKLALTEINNVASYLEMFRICDENKPRTNGLTKFDKEPYELEIAVGIEFRELKANCSTIGLAQNNDGFELLNRFCPSIIVMKKLPTPAWDGECVFIYPYKRLDPEQLFPKWVHRYSDARAPIPFSIDPFREEFKHKFIALGEPVTFLPPKSKRS